MGLRRRIDKWCCLGGGKPSGTFGPKKGGVLGSTPGVGLKYGVASRNGNDKKRNQFQVPSIEIIQRLYI